ncbi:hypothetical protein [Acidipropionibacterium virtanenii]|uniref:Uncharacterized protein n=1 Tax=Acidipropionibacterium virtanenii TaxID=2057246 RepID=A0A344UY74_9ACTN|nr:hypothetical protein [Acidipropionibacterium virtanenii]AXE40222.1 hypothetical protein JS278_03088 [Acidipropionibacterium virtanenii]
MADLDEKQQAALEAVWESAALLQGLRKIESMASDRFLGAVQDARKSGVPLGTIAQTVGLSASRLTQMITSRRRSRRAGPGRRIAEITATPSVESREVLGARRIA